MLVRSVSLELTEPRRLKKGGMPIPVTTGRKAPRKRGLRCTCAPACNRHDLRHSRQCPVPLVACRNRQPVLHVPRSGGALLPHTACRRSAEPRLPCGGAWSTGLASWQGRQDSNLRMAGSKPAALGLFATPHQRMCWLNRRDSNPHDPTNRGTTPGSPSTWMTRFPCLFQATCLCRPL